MKTFSYWPNPWQTLGLALLWLLLVNDLTLGHIMLGLLLGGLIAVATQRFRVKVPPIRKPLKLCLFFMRVAVDIVVANVQIARLVLGPVERLQPAFVEVPMQIEDEFVLSLLTSVISLTPGTVSAGLSADRKRLLLHALDAPNDQQIIDDIRLRYEAPLMEIFQCSVS